MNDKTKEFPKGLIVKPPRDGSPDFVNLSISIKIGEFQEFLSTKQTEWLNIDVKESKEGKMYAEVNNWKPDASKQKHDKAKADGYAPEKKVFVDDPVPNFTDDCPF
jgi:hypothetical protein